MEDLEMMKIEEFIRFVEHFQSHYHRVDESGCNSCAWVRSKLRLLQCKMLAHLTYYGASDDLIDWNTLILELLNEDRMFNKPQKSLPGETNKALKPNYEILELIGGQFRRIEHGIVPEAVHIHDRNADKGKKGPADKAGE